MTTISAAPIRMTPAPRAADEGAELTGFADWAVQVMEALGAPGVGLLVALENLFPPIPSEIILPLAGFSAARGSMSVVTAVLWATVGSLVGAIALYWIGRGFGRDRMYRIVAKLPLVDVVDLERTEDWFVRHGAAGVFFGRMVPIFRSLISIPAGLTRMRMLTFCAFTTAGSLIWNTIFVVAGYLLGANWHVVEEYAGIFQKIVIVAVAAVVVWWIVKRVRRVRAARARELDGV